MQEPLEYTHQQSAALLFPLLFYPVLACHWEYLNENLMLNGKGLLLKWTCWFTGYSRFLAVLLKVYISFSLPPNNNTWPLNCPKKQFHTLKPFMNLCRAVGIPDWNVCALEWFFKGADRTVYVLTGDQPVLIRCFSISWLNVKQDSKYHPEFDRSCRSNRQP